MSEDLHQKLNELRSEYDKLDAAFRSLLERMAAGVQSEPLPHDVAAWLAARKAKKD